ncbi:class I SAM-dependent DNA methyltransferase [Baekduia sp. Peel2402]|uniref:class I SAM-dependent DNA methyltransferase n=1 Tax=Baekduia sp. Peel2402 TaxID=3458296 RepID=UPI00403E95EF
MSVSPSTAAYDAFAPFYDILARDQDYDWWWSEMLALATGAGLPDNGVRALDVACGTGKSTAPLVARGWEVVGVDISAGMLAQARRTLGPDVPLIRHDMRELSVLGTFDLVSALSDAVNHLLDTQQLSDAFSSFHRNLAPGGVLVFDVVTLGGLRTLDTLVQQEPGRIVMLNSGASPDFAPGTTMRGEFVVLEQRTGFRWESRRVPHLQRHFTDAEIRDGLAAADLELHGVYGLSDRTIARPVDELNDERAIYIVRRPS